MLKMAPLTAYTNILGFTVFLMYLAYAKKSSLNMMLRYHQQICLSSWFSAPEIVNFDPITFATDMWAIGVMTYIL